MELANVLLDDNNYMEQNKMHKTRKIYLPILVV